MPFRSDFRITTVLLALLALAPIVVRTPQWQSAIIAAFYYAFLAIAWNILAGFTGQISFAVAAFASIGAYTAGLVALYGIPPYLGILLGVLVCAITGYLLGRLSLKLSGAYFSLVTLAFAEVVRIVIVTQWQWTRGELGLKVQPLLSNRANYVSYYYIFLAALVTIQVGVYLIMRSPIGLYLRGIRDNEVGAQSAGINIVRWKTIAAAISSAIAGLGGALYVHFLQLAVPQMGAISETGQAIAMTVIGGLATITGPMLGAVIMHLLAEFLTAFGAYHLIIFGLLVMVVARFFQEGLMGVVMRFWKGGERDELSTTDARSYEAVRRVNGG